MLCEMKNKHSLPARMAKAHYEAYFDGMIGCTEMPWKNLEKYRPDHKARLIAAMEAALDEIEMEDINFRGASGEWY